MRIYGKNKPKLNNKGMTLVEILIAMAILSVAIVPLLFSFVNVAKYNARGRELQQSTVLAQTIVENCKAYSKEEIEVQLNNGTFLNGVGASSALVSGNTCYMQNVPAENFLYDVTLEFTPCGINDSVSSSYDIMNSINMNPYSTAVYTPQGVKDVTNTWKASELDGAAYLLALQYIIDGIKAETETELGVGNGVYLTTAYVENSFKDSSNSNYGKFKISRSTKIDVSDSSGSEEVRVYVQYDFNLTGDKYSYDYVDATGADKTYEWSTTGITIGPFEYLIYSNSTTKDLIASQVNDIYFFYYPAYSSLLSIYPFTSDDFTITNSLSRDINLYMIKQKNPVYSDTNLITLENSYSTKVTTSSDNVFIFDNYTVNLGNDGTLPVQPSWYSGFSGTKIKNSLIVEESKTLMYELVVKLYDAGSFDPSTGTILAGSEPVLTMDGTALEW